MLTLELNIFLSRLGIPLEERHHTFFQWVDSSTVQDSSRGSISICDDGLGRRLYADIERSGEQLEIEIPIDDASIALLLSDDQIIQLEFFVDQVTKMTLSFKGEA